MKLGGFILFLAGLTVAAWYASYIPYSETPILGLQRVGVWASQAGLPFAGGLMLMIAGAIIARVANKPLSAKKDASGEGPARGQEVDDAARLLEEIATDIQALHTSDLPKGAKPLADAIEQILEEQVPAFLDHRQRLIEALGLESFAEMIGHFATMERGAARAWSALTDEAWDEVEPSLARAKVAAVAARAAMTGG